ncbi:MAG: saccharopine dehydrogenase family protein [Gammaproteobacteria bacterium]
MRIAIVGTGAMGLKVAEDLLAAAADVELLAVDASPESGANFKSALADDRVKGVVEDATNIEQLGAVLSGTKVVVNSAQFDVNRSVMKAALIAGAHYVDLGGMFHETRRQLTLHDEFKNAGLTAVVGIGAAPGITNILAAHACTDLEQVDSVEASFGASVEDHEGPQQFVPPYSLRTIMHEFMDESVQFLNGSYQSQPPMSGARMINFPDPIGELECIYTLHSEPATLPDFLREKGVRDVVWRLGLPAALTNSIRAFAAAGLGASEPIKFNGIEIVPIDFLLASIDAHQRTVDTAKSPYTETGCLRVEVTGMTSSQDRQTTVLTCQRSVTGSVPDMAGLITGVPCAIAALMLADGHAANPGVHAPEAVISPSKMFEELEKRGFSLKRETYPST